MTPYIYLQKICSLNNKTLTFRELDVISCLLSGRSIKKISVILGIEERTVEAHWQNIKNKTGLYSKDSLVSKVEQEGKKKYFESHYEHLLIEQIFSKCVHIHKKISIEIYYSLEYSFLKYYAEFINRQLKNIGINAKILSSEHLKNETIELKNLINDKDTLIHIQKSNTDDTAPNFFELLMDALKNIDDSIVIDIQKLKNLSQTVNLRSKKNVQCLSFYPLIYQKFKIKKITMIIFLSIIIGISIYKTFHHYFISNSFVDNFFESNMIQRNGLQAKIKNCLENKNGISYCALIGMMGAGKTVLAKLYAKNNPASFCFEIDSKTKSSIEKSYIKIAYNLSKSSADRDEIDFIKKISDIEIRQQQLIFFVEAKLKNISDWILIFDNVIDFKDIDVFVPKKASKNVNGRVIFTTCNRAIEDYLKIENCIDVNELTEKEAVEIFYKIYKVFKKEDVIEFLKIIPRFPLDIVISASYIKSHNISLLEYKERFLTGLSDNILNKRSIILKESFDSIFNNCSEFKNILCFLAFCDCNNIPKKLFYACFPHEVVDNLFNELKKHAFIVSDSIEEQDYLFSIHPTVHNFLLTFIDKKNILLVFKNELENILNRLNSIFEKKNETFLFFEHSTSHLQTLYEKESILKILNNKTELLSHLIIGFGHYFGSRNIEKAKNEFERVRLINKKINVLSKEQNAELLHIMSILYTDLGDGHTAIEYVDESLSYYKENSDKRAELLSQKGYALSLFNKFNDSEKSFMEGLSILDTKPKTQQNYFIKSTIYGQRAILHAMTFLSHDKENLSLKYIENAFSSLEFDGKLKKGISRFICYHYATLGHIYCHRGEFKLALSKGFDKAMYIIHNKLDGCSHHIIKLFCEAGIGECLLRDGKFNEAEKLLTDVVDRTYKLRGSQFMPVFKAQILLMECYLKLGKLEKAEDELCELLSFNVSDAPLFILFYEGYLYYLASDLYLKKRDFKKSIDSILIFFNKMKEFLRLFEHESFDITHKEIIIKQSGKIEDDIKILKKQAQKLLYKIYPNINFEL